jgi:hypothetical protein
MAVIPIYIPTYISDQTYTPCRVQPRLLFFNGMIDCESYYIESASAFGGVSREQTAFPYFDNYNIVSGSFPTTDSNSLLFYNEESVYGEVPTETLYSQYWEEYVELLYNPRTRLLNASTIIPLADYFKMELNDIVELRGNYYHLRAINNYNLKNGECRIELLGPILPDALVFTTTSTTTQPTTTTTSTTTTSTTTSTTTTSTTTSTTTTTATPSATLSWTFSETGGAVGNMNLYVNGSIIEIRSNTSAGTYSVYVGDTINVAVDCSGCSEPNNCANAYSFSNRLILADAACDCESTATIFTATYTVVSGDLGGTITLDTFASCDSGCI